MRKRIFVLLAALSLLVLPACLPGQEAAGPEPEASAGEHSPAGQAPETSVVSSPPADNPTAQATGTGNESEEDKPNVKVRITIGEQVFTATLYDNPSAKAIAEQMPFTLDMDDYAGQEKVTQVSFDLPRASTQTPSAIRAGELYLWSGNSLVLFYTSFANSYSYVPIGAIDDTAGLTDALGSGSVSVAFHIED